MNTSPLKVARTVAGLTQSELAAKADIDQTYLCRIERGRSVPGKHARRQVAHALGLREELIFGRRAPTAKTAD